MYFIAKWDLRSSGILRSVEWEFCTEVSRQPIGPIFKGQEVNLEVGTNMSRNVGTELPLNAA
jgi:hypothetical protein